MPVQVIVELRNYTGVMVIDRNDELCVMYERKSVQETVQKQGDYALAKLEDQIRVLKIDVTDVSRSIEATKKKCPEVPKLDKEIATLQRDILMTKREGRELEQQLEDPSNPSRWRMLHGRIKDKDELRIKVNQLEERLNHKKEQLLERDLILEEVSYAAFTTSKRHKMQHCSCLTTSKRAELGFWWNMASPNAAFTKCHIRLHQRRMGVFYHFGGLGSQIPYYMYSWNLYTHCPHAVIVPRATIIHKLNLLAGDKLVKCSTVTSHGWKGRNSRDSTKIQCLPGPTADYYSQNDGHNQ